MEVEELELSVDQAEVEQSEELEESVEELEQVEFLTLEVWLLTTLEQ